MLACQNSGFSLDDHFREGQRKPAKHQGLCSVTLRLLLNRSEWRSQERAERNRKNTRPHGECGTGGKLVSHYTDRGKAGPGHTQGLDDAVATHFQVGREIRKTIEAVGGTMQEDLPTPEKSISQIEREKLKQLRKDRKKLMLDE